MKLIAWLILALSILAFSAERNTLWAQRIEFTSSDVADAAERLTGHRAFMTNDIHLIAGRRLAGPAITMRVVRDDRASVTEEGLKAIKVIENAPAGSVIVLALNDDKSFAVFGATFATLAKSRKLAGFVIDGSMRGLLELKRLEFPTFARGMSPGSAGGHYRLVEVNVPLMCGGIEVSPGDFVVGDDDGVAVAPKQFHEEIFKKARELRREKRAMLPLITKYRSYTMALQQHIKAAQKLRAVKRRRSSI
jgi:regulator of RNase E activity RraA